MNGRLRAAMRGGVAGSIAAVVTAASCPFAAADWYALSTDDAAPVRRTLAVDHQAEAVMRRQAAAEAHVWQLVRADDRLYRVQALYRDRVAALAAASPTGPIRLEPMAGEARQLWRVVSADGAVFLENAAYPGRMLAGSSDGLVGLERSSGAPAQRWRVRRAPPAAAPPAPLVEVVSRELRPDDPLPPATVAMHNTHQRELWVLIADRRADRGDRRLRVPPGEAVEVELHRDSGATLVERYEIRDPLGVVEREEFVTRLPPAPRYDVSVYERFLQSIAIDRTGKSPERIEDVNYQPRSIGYFVLPPGDALRDGRIDVYAEAKERDNPGGVRRIDPEEWSDAPARPDPLETLLEEESRR